MRRTKRSKVAPKPKAEGLPDPFSRYDSELVEDEEHEIVYHMYACPCCIDRQIELEDSRYLTWLLESRK